MGSASAVLAFGILGAVPAAAQNGQAEMIDPAAGAQVQVAEASLPGSTTANAVAVDTSASSTVVTPAALNIGRPKVILTPAQRWLHFTTKSDETLDLDGIEASLYRGKFYRAQLEDKRRCIVKRESNGHYFSISHNGYRGAYQMSAALARGVTWMMLPEHRQILGDEVARDLMADLRETPANRWPRYWQDAAFSTIHNWEHTGSGASHWYGGRWHC